MDSLYLQQKTKMPLVAFLVTFNYWYMAMEFFLFVSLITIIFAMPEERIKKSVETEKIPSSIIETVSSTSVPPCHDQSEYRDIPQIVFPMCKSTHGSEGLRNVVVHGMACTCDLNTHDIHKRDDYQYTPGIGAHKLHTNGATFNDARKICNIEGAHLAVINSIAEEQVLLNLLKRAVNIKNATNEEQAFIGIHDMFRESDWVTILGDSIHKNGYTKWSERWGGQPDNGGGVQNCGTLLIEGGMDDVSCNAQFAFFCEIPGIRIAH